MENKDIKTEDSEQPRRVQKVSNFQNSVLTYLHDLVFLLAGLLLVFMLLFRIVVVSGPSMRDTLVDGDYLLVLSSSVYKNPRQGDVIVASKDSFKDGEPIVKRVIATEGQTVDIRGGVVYVNNVPLDESAYTAEFTSPNYDMDFPLVVEEGCLFVMGDNRGQSKDSRSIEIGQIDKREVIGKVLVVVLPGADPTTGKRNFSRFGAV